MSKTLDVLVIADIHYDSQSEADQHLRKRKTFWGPLFIQKALNRLKHCGIQIELIVLLGDLINRGEVTHAENDLKQYLAILEQLEIPYLALPGNHDGDPDRFRRIMNVRPGIFEIKGYGFSVFHDVIPRDGRTIRSENLLAQLKDSHAQRPDLPIIALQHNPVLMDLHKEYPYQLINHQQILETYQQTGVILSLSGHYHRGQAVCRMGDLTCYTVPAACEAPFHFAHIHLEENQIQITEHRLESAIPNLVDVHCHTEFAYCAETVAAQKNILIARNLGLGGICLIEHAFQLYFPQKQAWSYEWQVQSQKARRQISKNRGRMPEYRDFVENLRSDFVRLGLETDLCEDGQLLLAEEDWEGWDLLVGAVHQIPGFERHLISQAQAEKLFLEHTEKLLQQPIQVLAHPFRFFRRNRLEVPVHLYQPLAQMLAQTGIAAEINFHTNQPDPLFIEVCLEHGVKIALATDSHRLEEVGELDPHLRVLEKAGVKQEDFESILFRPGSIRGEL